MHWRKLVGLIVLTGVLFAQSIPQVTAASSTVIYDFVANAPYAEWKSAAGVLPYPGTSGDSRGYSFQVNNPHLEDNSFDTLPGLLMVPHNKYNGYIQAMYPEFLVEQGDHFQSLVNCEFGATGCYVTFNLYYMTSTGSVKTYWSWKEAYEGRFYRADVDLSRLAGQRVRFILNVSSSGSASGDRALWGAPRIVRADTVEPPAPAPTLTPLPALTPTATPFLEPPPLSPAACERASFVADITVPDGTVFSPNAAFTKTWRLKNTGTCAWTTAYNFVYYSGSQMGAPTVLRLPRVVLPGETVDLALNMVAPSVEGVYRGNWILQNASGALFGIGKNATMPVWAEIRVAGEASQENGYDFVKNACIAEWKVAVGISPCPGMNGDLSGFVLPVDSPKLEDGSIGTSGLLMAPLYKFNGTISGTYPAFTVQPGDRFQSTVGCEFGTACYVTFRLDYISASGSISNFWSWREQNDGRFYNANVDLTPLAGRSVRFILTLFSTGSPVGDRAIWGTPRILRAFQPPLPITITPSFTSTPTSTLTATATVTPTPTSTPTPPAVNWLTLVNPTYGFQLKYPADGQLVSGNNDNYTRINLPFQPGTNLREKYLEVIATQNNLTCRSPLGMSSILNTSENVTINGLTFLKETGGDGGGGHLHEWIAYSIAQGSTCVSLDFVLHSLNPGNFPPPQPPVFDKAAESAVFENIVSTFAWTSSNSNWLTYTNTKYSFRFMYPPEGQITAQNDNGAHITLPIIPGTNLHEKYLDLVVVENAATCHSPVQMAPPPMGTSETVTINGLAFLKETSLEGAAGNHYNLVVYSIPQGSTCISFVFTLHSIAASNVDPPLPEFDMAAETAVFQNMLATFAWLPANPMTTLNAVVDALNTQNFDAAKALMDQTFGFGFWGSEGTSSTPDLAIQQLKNNYIGPNTHLTPDASKDLGALLGRDPYGIMGLSPSNSQALFVSGWGLDGKGEAILYVTTRSDGSVYWHSVLIAPSGFAANGSAFCADTRIAPLIDQLKQSMIASDGTTFALLVSPQHGMDMTFWHGGTTVNYTTVTAQNVFSDPTVVNWGSAPGEGGPGHSGTFAQIVQPDLVDVFNSNYQLNCNDPSYAYMYPNAWPYPGINYYSVVKPPTNTFDWKVWLVGFEYVNGQPYLYGAIHWVSSP